MPKIWQPPTREELDNLQISPLMLELGAAKYEQFAGLSPKGRGLFNRVRADVSSRETVTLSILDSAEVIKNPADCMY